uniref:Signal recognition particle subunit SRP72 n=1 Tax=Aotus nancymaae TaxID=37293 RepID=A0A2K5EG77_AOTNA
STLGGSVPALWSEVNWYGQNGDFMRALKIVNKILQINKDDVTALHCKVVCLIQNGNFKEALNVINIHTKVLANNSLSFENYRPNRIENALKTTESANQGRDRLKELYGGVLHRLECYNECLVVEISDYEERKTNLSAIVAAESNWEKVAPENLGLQEGTHELCYNTACALIGQAEDLCHTAHYQKTFRVEQRRPCNFIIKLKPTDVGLIAIIKKMKLTNVEGVEFKLSKKQLHAIEFNKALLAMNTNQAEQYRKISANLQSQSLEHLLPVLIQAAQHYCEKQHTKATELLQEFSDQHPENAAEIKLTTAQLKISQSSISKACLVLRSIEELKHKPGIMSALHERDTDSATEWYQNHQPKSPAHLSLIREAAIFKLKYGWKQEAISDLEQLWKQNPKDIHTLAQLISAYSLVDPEKAKAPSKLSPLSDSTSLKADAEALENSPGATYIQKKGGKEQELGDLKKKGKLSNNSDPKVITDPERLKKGKRKDLIGKGTQGVTAGASSELDASKTVSSPLIAPRPGSAATVSASTSNIITPRHQKPAGAPATKKEERWKR